MHSGNIRKHRLAYNRHVLRCIAYGAISSYIAFLLINTQAQERIIKMLESDAVGYEICIVNLNKEIEQMKQTETPVKPESPVSRGIERTVEMTITAYCPCQICCGKTDGITASGAKAKEGITLAADERYSFGTEMYIEGFGWRTVQDRGGSIKGNHVDLYFDHHSDALEYGVRKMNVLVR